MTCEEAAPFVSVVCDGEPVAPEIARHIGECAECRERLRDYSRMGAELRLLASTQRVHTPIPPSLRAEMHRRRGLRQFTLPGWRLALATVAGAAIAVLATVPIVRAQSEAPRWFEFQLDTSDAAIGITHAEKAGYNDVMGWMHQHETVGAHIAITSVTDTAVKIAIRARECTPGVMPDLKSIKALGLTDHTFTYVPGQTLQIPIDGGGTLTLTGEVKDHQPRIAGGFPLEPLAGELLLRSPVLEGSGKVLADVEGANSIAGTTARGPVAATLGTGGQGVFDFALQPFPGAVKAKADWGRLQFKLGGEEFALLTSAPITGGEQPHPVWVRRDPESSWPGFDHASSFVGARSISALPVPQ